MDVASRYPTKHDQENVPQDRMQRAPHRYNHQGRCLTSVRGSLLLSRYVGFLDQYFDDTKRYVDALNISDKDKADVFEFNARRVFPRLDAVLKGQGR